MPVTTAVLACAFAPVCSPDGPGVPFGTPWLDVFDTARVLCVLLAVAALVLTPFTFGRVTARGQRARIGALSLLAVQAVVTEVEHLGDYASLRLALNLAAVVLALYGMLRLRDEQPALDSTAPRTGR